MPICSRWNLAHSNEFGGGGLIPRSQMSVMSLTYRKAVRGLIREERGGLKMNAPDVYCKIYCTSSLKVTINYISNDAPIAVKMDMIATVSVGGEVSHPLFLTSHVAELSQDQPEKNVLTIPHCGCNQHGGIAGWCKTRHTHYSMMHRAPGLRPQLVTAKHAGMLPGNVTSTKDMRVRLWLWFPLDWVTVCVGGFSRGTKGPVLCAFHYCD